MKNRNRLWAIGLLVLGMLMHACNTSESTDATLVLNSGGATPGQTLLTQKINLDTETPTCDTTLNACGNLSVDLASLQAGAIFRSDYNTWSLANPGEPVKFNLSLSDEIPVSFTIDVAASLVIGQTNSPVTILVNSDTLVRKYADTESGWHTMSWKIPFDMLSASEPNTISLVLNEGATNQYFIRAVSVSSFSEPVRVVSSNGRLNTPLYVQFGIANVTGTAEQSTDPSTEIWTRAYSLYPPQPDPSNPDVWLPNEDIVPGPTFSFKPNDVLTVDFVNNLNRTASPWLNEFEKSITSGNPDDIEEHVSHEVNIPHNADNTNLHTHGLHVDPRRDNVTLLIVPEDENPDTTLSPDLQKYVPNYTGSHVPGNAPANGDYWTWQYQYKIPADHLPGTHWYHAHKHGSTSTHVENGMAGTFVIRPEDDSNTFAPGLWNDDVDLTHDRVLVLQEIANYGIQQGNANGVKNMPHGGSPDITVNGMHQPTLQLTKGQIERWRFVNAGANHRTSSYLWLGKKTGQTDTVTVNKKIVTVPKFDGAVPSSYDANQPQMVLVALDGVTLATPKWVTAENPLLLAAGNRADVLIYIPESAEGEYAIFKNYPQSGATDTYYPGGLASMPAPANLLTDAYGFGSNYESDPLPYLPYAGAKTKTTAIIPILHGKATGTNKIEISSPYLGVTGPQVGQVGWQPSTDPGGGAVDNQLLFFVNMVDGKVDNHGISTNLTTVSLSEYSVTGTASNLTHQANDGTITQGKAPSYAAPIMDSDLTAAPQTMVFDLTGIEFNYTDGTDSTVTKMKQFSLNGRQFDLVDYVGNTAANAYIQDPITDTVHDHMGGKILGYYNYQGKGLWDNQAKGATIDGHNEPAYWTNPGYYMTLTDTMVNDTSRWIFDYAGTTTPPSINTITKTPQSQPMNQTAQEWLLVNNSDVFHPFHIHISPFFVTEIGQLNYDATKGWQMYFMEKDFVVADNDKGFEIQSTGAHSGDSNFVDMTSTSPVNYVVGNWWDVILIPPRGYVVLKTWINVPWQDMTSSSIEEDSNNSGVWVFHCHILRHEDRGMMMIVKTRPKPAVRKVAQ